MNNLSKNYKIKFTDKELSKFNNANFNENKTLKLMSVFSYIKKYSVQGVLSKTINKLHKMYIKYHYDISNKYFYNLVDVLIDVKLIKKENNIVSIFNNNLDIEQDNNIDKVQGEIQAKVQTEDTPLDLNTPTLEAVLENRKYNSKDLNYTNTHIYKDNDDIVAPVEVVNSVIKIAKDLGINQKRTIARIQEMIKCKIMKYEIQINRAGLEAYLRKTILEKYNILCYYSKLKYQVRIQADNRILEQMESNLNYSGDIEELESMLLNH